MKTFKSKPCKHCGASFTPDAPCNLFCVECQKLKPEWERARSRSKRLKERIQIATKNGTLHRIGIGKGNGQPSGQSNPNWRKGLGWYHKEGKRLKALKPFCERCERDLRDATPWEWCTHHRDHNRLNNVTENFEILCKKCHQREHDAGAHLRKPQ